MTQTDKTLGLRQLIPKSYHFDGYSNGSCQNARDKPFWSDNNLTFSEDRYLTIRLLDIDQISIEFSSPCPRGKITYLPYILTLDDFAKAIREAVKTNRDCIFFKIISKPSLCNKGLCKEQNSDCKMILNDKPNAIYAAISFDFEEMKEALAMYFEIQPILLTNGGKNTMARNNKFFGLNFEFGVSKDLMLV